MATTTHLPGAADNVDSVPGTVFLVQEEGDAAHHKDRIILSPHPSLDPEDPLNWTRKRKLWSLAMTLTYVLGVGITTTLQYSVLTQIHEDTGITVGALNTGTGLMFLFLGWACLLWQPIALVYGRRGIYILSTVLSIGPMVWQAYSNTAGEWYAHRIIIGILASPIESLPEVSIPDVFFAHERGFIMGIYAFTLFGSNFIAPIIAGWMAEAVGWRWTMHFGSFLLAGTALVLFFGMEETMYFRPAVTEGRGPASLSEKTDGVVATDEKIGDGTAVAPVASPAQVAASYPPPQTYAQRLRLFRRLPGGPPAKQVFTMMYRPLLIILRFPNTAWAGFLYGSQLSWYNVLNATTSSIWSAAPYNFNSGLVGTAYVAPLIGAGLASLWSGKFGDSLAIRLAKRNGGIREPEHRLWNLALSTILTPAGLILWGVGAARKVAWVGPAFGIGITAFGIVCSSATALSYNVDCFKELDGETLISVILIRNTMGFAFSYAITPWIDNQGLVKTFVAVAMIALATSGTFLLVVVFGKGWRRRTKETYWKYVATSAAPVL
jgi:MFS family permease